MSTTSIKKFFSIPNILGVFALITIIYSATLFAAKLDLNREQTQVTSVEQKSINEVIRGNISTLQNNVSQNTISINRLDIQVDKLEQSYQSLNPQLQVLINDVKWVKEYLQKNPAPSPK